MKLIGTTYCGALGSIPQLQADTPKPKLTNGGYGVFHGQADAIIPNLKPLLEMGEQACPCGHVEILYADGQSAVLFAYSTKGQDIYSFS